MYEHFFGLTERPFSLLPDPDFLYLSPQHKLARAYLEYGLTQKIGFVVLTGEIGTGKTTLIKSILKAKGGKQRLGVLYQTSFDAGDLLELLLREFEIQGHFNTRAARLSAFNQFLIQAFSRGEHVVLIVDEAHNLGAAALEEVRLLSNIQTDKEPLLQVILVGQPNLRDRLRQPSLRQLAQRVGVHFHLQPLDEEESKEYIQYRLARAGAAASLRPPPSTSSFRSPRVCLAASTPGATWPWWPGSPKAGRKLTRNSWKPWWPPKGNLSKDLTGPRVVWMRSFPHKARPIS